MRKENLHRARMFPQNWSPEQRKTFFSKDQLILTETQIPQEVSDIIQRAEKAGIGVFEPYHLSGVTLGEDSNVYRWEKPEPWYWEQIAEGNLDKDAPKLPDSWVLVDKTKRPDYEAGKQLHKDDVFAPLLKKLREDKKLQTIKSIPDTSRFGISFDELIKVILPEIARLLRVESSQVRLPKAIEFNVIGNMEHPEWGKANTWEWFGDELGARHRLIGGSSRFGGLSRIWDIWSGSRESYVAFRSLVVVSSKS